jgi:DNA helicase-2/ATP-dependent DNA helicase PcrA
LYHARRTDAEQLSALGSQARHQRATVRAAGGPANAAKLLDAVTGNGDTVGALRSFRPPSAAVEHWPEFVETISTLHLSAAGWPAELDLAYRWYAPHMERRYEDAAHREADLTQLAQIAASYPTRERFLTELTLDPPDATSDEAGVPLLDEDYLILSTIHSAKGQEWTSVFLLNTVDGCIPSDLATGSTPEIEEERRLLYVAMTGQGPVASHGSPTLLHPWSAKPRRPARLCAAHALYSEWPDQTFPEPALAAKQGGQ